jgi:hypothetical protein
VCWVVSMLGREHAGGKDYAGTEEMVGCVAVADTVHELMGDDVGECGWEEMNGWGGCREAAGQGIYKLGVPNIRCASGSDERTSVTKHDEKC